MVSHKFVQRLVVYTKKVLSIIRYFFHEKKDVINSTTSYQLPQTVMLGLAKAKKSALAGPYP